MAMVFAVPPPPARDLHHLASTVQAVATSEKPPEFSLHHQHYSQREPHHWQSPGKTLPPPAHPVSVPRTTLRGQELAHDWYRHAIIYQIRVDNFADGRGLGTGDLLGVIAHLPYIKSLGVNCIWLSPVCVSPMRDGGYDSADFTRVDPTLGTDDDLQTLIGEAHRLGLRVMLDFVVNHTSIDHVWFEAEERYKKLVYQLRDLCSQAEESRFIVYETVKNRRKRAITAGAVAAETNRLLDAFSIDVARLDMQGYYTLEEQLQRLQQAFGPAHLRQPELSDFYIWETDNTRYREAFVAFRHLYQSVWQERPGTGEWLFHSFYDHQADLNYRNPRVRRAILNVLTSWAARGIDALRVDAAPFFWKQDKTDCIGRPEVHQIFKQWRRVLQDVAPHVVLMAEAVEPANRLQQYFGDGDEFHMMLNFPLVSAMFLSVAQQTSAPLDGVLQSLGQYPSSVHLATFLRNHDELSAEHLPAHEQRDMLRRFAPSPRHAVNGRIHRRLMPLAQNRQTFEMLVSLLMAMPGTPILYYGDEIGMGDRYEEPGLKVEPEERDGVRTPMQWSAAHHAGFSSATGRLKHEAITGGPFGYEQLNVAAQSEAPDSLLNWHRHLLQLRRANPVLAIGCALSLQTSTPQVFAMLRYLDREEILVVANLGETAALFSVKGVINVTPISLQPHGYRWLKRVGKSWRTIL